ncbi:crotonase/enoyl-CoA hydratase family protein [Aliiruegeria lutimaris]|uniref:Enoyl-CoA hydratase/carnithine racemase n=1 Tax=Aliiruegeria lutimaris TaxID=571298 RepID=A0A1G8SMI3_9RHOB|nr:crotonase/enoyl-CoA hydratase family protein [Aliiruegeria lutimaris]SDJ29820.1 Enoyl-CoA hydratase/carnithine racemase [Aliiruegeria lutimaris]
MSQEFVELIGADEAIAEVRLNRPEKKNALTLEMLDALVAAGKELASKPGLRAVILSGEGGDFSAGLDTGALMAMAGKMDAIKQEMLSPPECEIANRFQLPAVVWSQLAVPVIAALEGVCFGGGAQIALGADFRVARPDMRFSIMEGKWGLIPDMGISQSLPKLLPADRAKELIMTARVITGAEAHALGLVTRLSDAPRQEARAFAEALAGRSPDAIRSGKQLVDAIYAGQPAEHLRLEAVLQAELMGAPNQVETIMANMQKRPPVYR